MAWGHRSIHCPRRIVNQRRKGKEIVSKVDLRDKGKSREDLRSGKEVTADNGVNPNKSFCITLDNSDFLARVYREVEAV